MSSLSSLTRSLGDMIPRPIFSFLEDTSIDLHTVQYSVYIAHVFSNKKALALSELFFPQFRVYYYSEGFNQRLKLLERFPISTNVLGTLQDVTESYNQRCKQSMISESLFPTRSDRT